MADFPSLNQTLENKMSKTVAILGTGVVGISLAKGFAARGAQVIFATRDAGGNKAVEAVAAVPTARTATFAEAAQRADMAVVALPWSGLEAGLKAAGEHNLAGKLVIDASNPLDFSSGAPQLAIGFTDSAGEHVQRLLPLAKVVKAFNTIGAAHMVEPKFADGTPDMFIAGNDAGAKGETVAILRTFGWRDAIDFGDITTSRLLEPLAMMWITYGLRNDHWTHGVSFLGK